MDCRILYLVRSLVTGIERKVYSVLCAMDREHYRPAVAIWSPTKRDLNVSISRVKGLEVPVFPLPPGLSRIAKMAEFRRLVKRLNPEVVHSYSFFTNLYAWWGTLGTRSVPIGSVNADFHQMTKVTGTVLGRLHARWPRHQIFNNVAAAEQACNHRTLFKPEQIFVIRNGIDLQEFTVGPPPNSSVPQLIGVGSLTPVKRWDRLLRAALDLKEKGPEFFIRIAGNGPLKGSLQNQVQEFGLQNYVEFIGHCSDISQALARSDFLVHTADYEGVPNVVMEAMACGRAVVSTDVGEVPHLVDDGNTGFVIRRDDGPALAERMRTLITNRDLRQKMGEAGRARIADPQFSWDRAVSEVLAAYRAAGWRDR